MIKKKSLRKKTVSKRKQKSRRNHLNYFYKGGSADTKSEDTTTVSRVHANLNRINKITGINNITGKNNSWASGIDVLRPDQSELKYLIQIREKREADAKIAETEEARKKLEEEDEYTTQYVNFKLDIENKKVTVDEVNVPKKYFLNGKNQGFNELKKLLQKEYNKLFAKLDDDKHTFTYFEDRQTTTISYSLYFNYYNLISILLKNTKPEVDYLHERIVYKDKKIAINYKDSVNEYKKNFPKNNVPEVSLPETKQTLLKNENLYKRAVVNEGYNLKRSYVTINGIEVKLTDLIIVEYNEEYFIGLDSLIHTIARSDERAATAFVVDVGNIVGTIFLPIILITRILFKISQIIVLLLHVLTHPITYIKKIGSGVSTVISAIKFVGANIYFNWLEVSDQDKIPDFDSRGKRY